MLNVGSNTNKTDKISTHGFYSFAGVKISKYGNAYVIINSWLL